MVNNCTKASPMPPENQRDQMGQHWIHVDAKPVSEANEHGNAMFYCPNCKLHFGSKLVPLH